ncbi:sortase-like acyltransferase [Halobacteroides halobius DSM 5150]|uniref:Sortase-like acyltransferase n=1 Tax=Halobacteroides halobius (strain ATCC 35273 / DSM 5150 / MD-1) TaxID=748449 RepID=L0K9V5_HALHC|nr:GNAT family N-acetyltransferase [Halobacteroides halobius]AGB40883.1 sortase-like acyltransferase [Halobacteroides halobius DSM 5150]
MQQFVYTNEGKVLLREAKESDIPKVYEMYQDYYPKSWWKSKELNQLRYEIIKEANGRVFVAVLNDKVIGHAEIVLPHSKERPVYLVRLDIHDDYRRRKFGIELVRYSAIIMKNLGCKGYVTWPDVDKSKGLFKKVGLKELSRDPQLKITIINKRETSVKKIGELSFSERPKDLEVVVGCPWGRNYNWIKSFRACQEDVLNYQGPFVHQVEVDGIKGVVLLDGVGLQIYLPQDKTEENDVIEKLIVYGSNLALEKGIKSLHINLRTQLWSQFDMSDIWQVEGEDERLEMKMDF